MFLFAFFVCYERLSLFERVSFYLFMLVCVQAYALACVCFGVVAEKLVLGSQSPFPYLKSISLFFLSLSCSCLFFLSTLDRLNQPKGLTGGLPL